MSDVEVFVLDDDFDPLEDLELIEDGEGQETDYLPPIPDADKSVVPEAVPLPASQRIERLLEGIPGQQFRILHAVELCAEPKVLDEVVAALDAAYPASTSVYDATQIVMLLERAGALERLQPEEATMDESAGEDAVGETTASGDGEFLTVTPAPRARFVATQDGQAVVAQRVGQQVVLDMLAEEPQYLPLYQRILEQCSAEGGCETKELDALVDVDPLCAEPRRFCGYFRGKLENTGALVWCTTWKITDLGARVLASSVFDK